MEEINGLFKRKYREGHLDTCYFPIGAFCVWSLHAHHNRPPSRGTTVTQGTEDGGCSEGQSCRLTDKRRQRLLDMDGEPTSRAEISALFPQHRQL